MAFTRATIKNTKSRVRMTQTLIHVRTSRKSQNQCYYCKWFDRWEKLEQVTFAATVDFPSYTVYAHVGASDNDVYGEENKACLAIRTPNQERRERPRCPDCGHGSPDGHSGRSCPVWIRDTTKPIDEFEHGDYCGCLYVLEEIDEELTS